VRHGQLNMVSVEIGKDSHEHPHGPGKAGHTHRHEHIKPKN
jgi:hypothetical protein